MNNEKTQRFTKRSRRTAVIAAGLVAILAGVAVAFFLTTQATPNNTVTGGALTVTTDGLPLAFTDQDLYPTNPVTPSAGAIVETTFEVTNLNPVKVSYLLHTACTNCTDASASDQWDNLYIRITKDSASPTAPLLGTPVYEGKIADLNESNAANLGSLDADGSQGYTVEMWLCDSGSEQPQNIQSIFDVLVSAKTPA
ncbi:MAG: hypothetical protein ACR2H3_05950 [Acidimicrobiales bacterium]